MSKHPVLEIPVCHVMRPEIALPLQHVLKIYTVGSFLGAWRNPRHQKTIEQLFESPQQARHAAATCAGWLGVKTPAAPNSIAAWWLHDARAADSVSASAAQGHVM